MRKPAIALIGVFFPFVALCGCTSPPVPVDLDRLNPMRTNLGPYLPAAVHLTDYVETSRFGFRITVDDKLASLGAHVGPDGKLYDRSGREIAFFRHYDGGVDPGIEFFRRADEELRELKRTHTVIELFHDPRLPNPC